MKTIGSFIICLCILNGVTSSQTIQKTNNTPGKPIRLFLDEILSDEIVNYSQLFSDYQLIPLETNNQCLIDQISGLHTGVQIKSNIIFILNMKRMSPSASILMFSLNGKYLSKIDRTGRGPGEYISLYDYDIDDEKKQVAVLDGLGKKLNFYDFNGSFIREVKLDYRFSSFELDRNDILLYQDPIPVKSKDYAEDYLIHILTGNTVTKLLKTYGVRKMGIGVSGINFHEGKIDIKFSRPFCDTIYSIKKGLIEPFLVLDSEKYRLTDDDLERIDNDFKNRQPGSTQPKPPLFTSLEKFKYFSSYSENDKLIFIEFPLGMSRVYLFYNSESGKIICTKRFKDDLTNMFPSLETLYGNKMIAYIQPSRFPEIKKDLASGKIKVSGEKKEILSKITEFDNPVIVIFTLNESMFR